MAPSRRPILTVSRSLDPKKELTKTELSSASSKQDLRLKDVPSRTIGVRIWKCKLKRNNGLRKIKEENQRSLVSPSHSACELLFKRNNPDILKRFARETINSLIKASKT